MGRRVYLHSDTNLERERETLARMAIAAVPHCKITHGLLGGGGGGGTH
jgi:hypothetical protein